MKDGRERVSVAIEAAVRVIRESGADDGEAEALIAALRGHSGRPPTDQQVLVVRSEYRSDVALCDYVAGEVNEYRLQEMCCEIIWVAAEDWPPHFRWFALPGLEDDWCVCDDTESEDDSRTTVAPLTPGRYCSPDGVLGTIGNLDALARCWTFCPDGHKPRAVVGPDFPDGLTRIGMSGTAGWVRLRGPSTAGGRDE